MKFIPEIFRTRVLLGPQATGTGTGAYASPTGGVGAITIRAIALMANAADLTLSLNYADDATGTNAAAFPADVKIYKNGVAQTAAKEFAVSDATGNHIVDFCINPALIPAGKFVGLAYANSNAANLVTTVIIEDCPYKPTATA